MQCHAQGCEATHPNDSSSDDEELGARNGGDGNKLLWYHHCPEALYSDVHQRSAHFTLCHKKDVS